MSVGLDIGSKTVKAVELTGGEGRFSLRAVGAIGHANPPVDLQSSEKEISALSETVKKLVSDARISGREVAISIPETQTFTKIMKFPLLNEQEIDSAVKWGAEEHIPIPISEAVVQHQIIERRENANPPQTFVLLVAASRALVEKYVRIANLSGFEVTAVETEMISIIRSSVDASKTSLVIDMGATSTDVAIAKGGRLYLSRSITTAGNAFTRVIEQSLGVSQSQADEYKRAYGLSEKSLEGKVGRALMPIFRTVADEAKKAVHYYNQETAGDNPVSVTLVGGSAGLPNAAATLAKLLGYEVTIGDAFAKVSLDPNSKKELSGYQPLYAVAAGLAMRKG